MKNINLNILQLFILFLSISTLITSCSNEKTDTQVDQVIAENLNTYENRKLISDLFTKGTVANQKLEDLAINQQFTRSSNEKVNPDELLAEYQECSDCLSEYKDFLIPLLKQKTRDSRLRGNEK